MNRKNRFVIAVVLALVVMAVAANVWASPMRRGTVPVPPVDTTKVSCKQVDMIKVIFTIFPLDDKLYQCDATNITKPEPDEYGPAPENTAFYSDIYKFVVSLDGVEVKDIQTEVCYPYPPEYEEKEAKIYRWDVDLKEWQIVPGDGANVPDGGLASGDPKLMCVKSLKTGIFSLIGNP